MAKNSGRDREQNSAGDSDGSSMHRHFSEIVAGVRDYAIFTLDVAGYVTSWNAGAERIKGYEAEDIIGKHFSRFYPPEAIARNWPGEELKIAAEQGRFEEEGWRIRKDGTRFWADVLITALRSPDGKLTGFLKITRDLTERKQFKDLEQSQQRTHEFLAMLSHELRNPLAPLKTSVEIMRLREMNDPVLIRAREVIERQVQHLTHLVEELLDVSRITSGRIRLTSETLDIESIVLRAIEAARPLLDSKGHSLEIEAPGSHVWVRGDLTRLTQVFVNLLNNAAKYTPAHGHIEVEIRSVDKSAAVHIRDNGVGIAPELLPRIFDLFTQGTRPLDRTDGGLGVGLALVHRIVSLHGGFVKACSEGTGRGSELVVTLPQYSEEISMPVASDSPPTEPQQRPRRLLVIDDNKDAAESMSMLFELWGHEVICAYDGQAALETAARYRPDAVFLDIGLPGMDGYEIAERLRELPESAHTVLVAITGYGQDEDRRRSREAGIDHHLVKPVSPDTLHKLLESLGRK